MHGEVSKTGGTDAGVFPKYKNDIIRYIKIMLIQVWSIILNYLYFNNIHDISVIQDNFNTSPNSNWRSANDK